MLLLVSISISGSLLLSTRASAASSEWRATHALQAGNDSVAAGATQRPATSTVPVYTPLSSTTGSGPARQKAAAATGPKPKAWRMDLHGGLFEPIDVNAPSPSLSLRLGRRLGGHLHAGALIDWTFERKNLEQPVNGLPGLQPHLILARADAQLVPAMGFFEVSLTEKRFFVPYFGIAAGYEWLLLKVNDYRTGASASTTFENFAWQWWGGLGMKLDQGLRFDGELFYNGGSLERDVVDPTGLPLKEAVNVNGVGARVGLSLRF